MAYDRDTLNSMQMNLGLTPGGGAPPQLMIIPPAMAAQQMQTQASQQLAAGAAMTRLPAATPLGVFGQQFQNQFQMAQSQQSYNPYIAQALSGGGGYQGMPSPLMMTPPSTGMFRPPPQQQMAAIPPQQVAPFWGGGITPQLPSPMFQTAWDRELQQREYRADKIYSMVAQTPRAMGMAAGIGAGAFAGAKVGGVFGPLGGLAGMVGGGLAAGFSGFAGGAGDMAMMPMRPSLEVHGMGASLQRMSQQWVVAGPQMHQQGAGFSRTAAQDMATQIRSLASDRSFRAETGGQFNREDLMRMTETSGRAGLMDMDQSVDAVRTNLRQVARTVRRFMQLTGDPDVTSVIREMGQMRAYGMSVPEMERAAQNMKTFARAAGTSIQGLQAMGGMPGAMTYSGMGLSAGAGFEAGNYSLAAARQAVASGAFNIRELSMLGGVQGVAQRNVQAGAAMMSMPLFGAAIGSYGAQGWNVNYGNLAQAAGGGQGGMGAAGMVMGAVQNMGQAVAQGGVGALAEYQLRQRFMQDDAARAMSPAQQMAMRFKMAQQTGQTLGLHGTAAFTVGARAMYGDEVAEQMMMEARNPESFRAQARMMRRENQEIAARQRADIMGAAPGTLDIIGMKLGISTSDRGVFTGGGSIGNALSDAATAFGRNSLFRYMEDVGARKNGERVERVSALAGIESEAQRRNIMKAYVGGGLDRAMGRGRAGAGQGESSWLRNQNTLMLNNTELGNAAIRAEESAAFGGAVLGIGGAVVSFVPGVGTAVGAGLGLASVGLDVMGQTGFQATQILDRMSATERAAWEKGADVKAQANIKMLRASRNVTAATIGRSVGAAAKGSGVSEDKIYAAKSAAASELVKIAKDRLNVMGADGQIGGDDVYNAVAIGLKRAGLNAEQTKAALKGMIDDGSMQQYQGDVINTAKQFGGAATAPAFKKMEESSFERLSGGASGKALQDTLAATSRGYEEMAGWGKEGDIGANEIRSKAKGYSESEFLGIAYQAATGDMAKQKAIWERAKALGQYKTQAEFEAAGSQRFSTLSDKGKTALGVFASKASAGQIGSYSETKQAEGAVGSIAVGANRLGKALGVAGLGDMTDEQKVATLTTQDNLAKLGGMGKGDLVKQLLAAQGATGTAKEGLMRQAMASLSEGFGPGTTTEALGQAEGEGAAQNEASAKALEEVAASLKDAGFDKFKDGASDFVEGAKALRAAMESDTIKSALEGAKTQP